MTIANGDAQARLTAFFKDWRQAQQRLQMAEQSLLGAQTDMLAKEARFKGAAELLYGINTAFEYDEKSGKLTFRPASVPPTHGPGKRRKR